MSNPEDKDASMIDTAPDAIREAVAVLAQTFANMRGDKPAQLGAYVPSFVAEGSAPGRHDEDMTDAERAAYERGRSDAFDEAIGAVHVFGVGASLDSTIGLNFGEALSRLKAGERVARAGWNGKGMWLALWIPGHELPMSRSASDGNPERVVKPCITMKTADGVFQPGWLASQADMLAEDWMVVTA